MPREVEDVDFDNVKKRYLNGHSLRDVAVFFGYSHGAIDRFITKLGIKRSIGETRNLQRRLAYEKIAPEVIFMYNSGSSFSEISDRFKIGSGTINKMLTSNGVKIRGDYLHLYPEIVRLYSEGVSELEVSNRLNISRGVVSTAIRKAGVRRRNGSEANTLRMQRLTFEERQALTAGCHTVEAMAKCAATSETTAQRVGENEFTLRKWLKDAGIRTVGQMPVGPYNLDLFSMPVAVEVSGSVNNPLYQVRYRKRTKYLLERGFWVIYVCFAQRLVTGRRIRFSPAVTDKIVSFIEFARRNPSSLGKYWVVWGDGEPRFLDSSYEDFNHRPLIWTTENGFQLPQGSGLDEAGEAVGM